MSEGFNKSIVIVGPSGYGKTTAARAEVAAHLQEFEHGLVFVHDCNIQFRDYCAVYTDVAAWKAAAAAAAAKGTPMPRGASIAGDAEELTREVIELGKRFNTAERTRVPIFLAYDESSLMETSGSTYMGKLDVKLQSMRRHWGIGLLYNVQEVGALTRGFYGRATKVIAFSQPSELDTDKLELALGLPAGALRALVRAPKHHYAVWERDKGLVQPGKAA